MEFEKLINRLKNIAFQEIRVQSADYFEAVVVKEKLSELGMNLSGVFGSPVWPGSGSLPKEASKVIDEFGGIRDNQTLYYFRENEAVFFTMLWPWNDGERVTLKVGQK